MRPYYDECGIQIYLGDCQMVLRNLPDRSIHSCVTSPPYFGLRDYKIEPLVWGGAQHEHQWGDEARSGQRQRNGASGGLHEGRATNGLAEIITLNPGTGRFCTCGAWLGSLGMEPTPELYVQHLVEVFCEVRRVLRDDGTLWLNLGDSYNNRAVTRPSSHQSGLGFQNVSTDTSWRKHARTGLAHLSINDGDLKEKDLIGIPWMTAFALRADGWYLRRDIIWNKPSCMPESVSDRCTTSHEYVFMLSKQSNYFYDAEAIKEPSVTEDIRRPYTSRGAWELDGRPTEQRHGGEPRASADPATRNKRSVWTVNTKPFAGAHFAVFPVELVAPMVMAGSPQKGVCPDCAAPWERVVEIGDPPVEPTWRSPTKRLAPHQAGNANAGNMGFRASKLSGQEINDWKATHTNLTTGWRPTCSCYDVLYRAQFSQAHNPRKRSHRLAWPGGWWERVRQQAGKKEWVRVPAVVMDVFAGSGTVGVVGRQLQRNAILIEANGAYCELAKQRISAPSSNHRVAPVQAAQASLFDALPIEPVLL